MGVKTAPNLEFSSAYAKASATEHRIELTGQLIIDSMRKPVEICSKR
jgi:hypothetical protein